MVYEIYMEAFFVNKVLSIPFECLLVFLKASVGVGTTDKYY